MVHTHGMQTHFDVCLMKHNQQGKSEAETSQCLPKPTAIMLGQLVILILHISALLLAYVMESNVLAFTGKGDAVHSRPVGHLSFPGIKDRHSAGLWGNKTIRSSGTWSKWSFYSCKEDGICLTNYNTRYKWFKYYKSNRNTDICVKADLVLSWSQTLVPRWQQNLTLKGSKIGNEGSRGKIVSKDTAKKMQHGYNEFSSMKVSIKIFFLKNDIYEAFLMCHEFYIHFPIGLKNVPLKY